MGRASRGKTSHKAHAVAHQAIQLTADQTRQLRAAEQQERDARTALELAQAKATVAILEAKQTKQAMLTAVGADPAKTYQLTAQGRLTVQEPGR